MSSTVDKTTDLSSFFGKVKCTALPPNLLFHPVLPYRYASKLTFPLCKTYVEQFKPPNSTMRSQKTISSTTPKTPKEIHASFPSSGRMPFTATPNYTSSQRQLLERNIAYNKHVLEPGTFVIYAYEYERCHSLRLQTLQVLNASYSKGISRTTSTCWSQTLS